MTELRIIAKYTMAAGQESRVLELVRELTQAVRTEEGNLSFEAYRSVDHENALVLLEQYVSREAFQAHRETSHFTAIVLEQIVPLLTNRVVEFYDVE